MAVHWSADTPYHVTAVPSSPDTTFCIDCGTVALAGFAEKLSDTGLKLFCEKAQALDADVKSGSASMHVASFCCTVLASAHVPNAVKQQIFGQIAAHVDLCVPDVWKENPLDIVETVASLPSGSRRDVVLAEALSVGLGSSDSKGSAHNTAQHVQSYTMFMPGGKGQRNMNPQAIDHDMLLKHEQVQECTWPQAQHLSCSCDGVRVSNKDVVYYALSGKIQEEWVTGWSMRVARLSLRVQTCGVKFQFQVSGVIVGGWVGGQRESNRGTTFLWGSKRGWEESRRN